MNTIMASGQLILSVFLLSILEIGVKAATLSPFIQHYETLNYNLEEIHQQHRRAVRSPWKQDADVELKFSAHNRDFHLRLRRDTSVFTTNFKLISSDGEETPDVSFFYSGELADAPGSYCHGSISDDGLFQGKIHVGSDIYSVEPASNYQDMTPDSSASHSVIYAAKDVDYSALGGGGCGLMKSIQERMEAKMKEAEGEETEMNKGDGSSYFARHKREISTAQTCTLFIRTDKEFYERFGSRTEVIKQIGEHVQAASNIYSKTDFGSYQDINFAVAKLQIFIPDDGDSSYPFTQENLGVEKYLDLASTGDLSDYCLAYTFSNRDFANGVLGLAWIATTVRGSTGGLCAPKLTSRDTTLNTGIVTVNNYGAPVPPIMSHITFAHEIGHSFGSNHDDMTNQVCSPTDANGKYIMFAHASSGAFPNNDDFSSCSTEQIANVLATVFSSTSKTNCFVERSSVTLCGNEVLEEDEMCDCGYADTCQDVCCIAPNTTTQVQNSCNLRNAAICSPQQGPCCDPVTCNYRPVGTRCQGEGDCTWNATCTGSSYECSTAARKPDHTKCDSDRKYCKAGMCTESVCAISNLVECQCTEQIDQCQICCGNTDLPTTCVTASNINIYGSNNRILYHDIGTPCNDNMGYCDPFNYCMLADEDGPLAAIIRKIFYNDEVQLTDVIWTWIQTMWWVILIIVIILIILMVLVVFCCERIIPSTNPWRLNMEQDRRRSSINVKLRKKRNRGSQYYGQPPPTSLDQHPDVNAQNRATRF